MNYALIFQNILYMVVLLAVLGVFIYLLISTGRLISFQLFQHLNVENSDSGGIPLFSTGYYILYYDDPGSFLTHYTDCIYAVV